MLLPDVFSAVSTIFVVSENPVWPRTVSFPFFILEGACKVEGTERGRMQGGLGTVSRHAIPFSPVRFA